jgi:hypothetical protein
MRYGKWRSRHPLERGDQSRPYEFLAGPLQSILGVNAATASASNATAQSQILSGPSSMLGVTATTTAGSEIAQATVSAGTADAKAIVSAGNTQASAIQGLAKQQAQSTQSTNRTSAAYTQAAVNAANTDTNTALGTLKDLFTSGSFLLFGIVLLAGAVIYFMKTSDDAYA